MLIPVNVTLNEGSTAMKLPPQFAQFGSDEVVLVELQGALDVQGNIQGQFVGKLSIEDDSKKPTLLIGHHLLEGKLVNLPKPLAVMHRKTLAHKISEPPDDSNALSELKGEQPPEWDIVAVVRRKMVFSKRPMPMVGRVSTFVKPVSTKEGETSG